MFITMSMKGSFALGTHRGLFIEWKQYDVSVVTNFADIAFGLTKKALSNVITERPYKEIILTYIFLTYVRPLDIIGR